MYDILNLITNIILLVGCLCILYTLRPDKEVQRNKRRLKKIKKLEKENYKNLMKNMKP